MSSDSALEASHVPSPRYTMEHAEIFTQDLIWLRCTHKYHTCEFKKITMTLHSRFCGTGWFSSAGHCAHHSTLCIYIYTPMHTMWIYIYIYNVWAILFKWAACTGWMFQAMLLNLSGKSSYLLGTSCVTLYLWGGRCPGHMIQTCKSVQKATMMHKYKYKYIYIYTYIYIYIMGHIWITNTKSPVKVMGCWKKPQVAPKTTSSGQAAYQQTQLILAGATSYVNETCQVSQNMLAAGAKLYPYGG